MQIQVHNKLLPLQEPQVMGIINITPDSFYSGSRRQSADDIHTRIKQMRSEGATIIDVGAMSTRPGHIEISCDEELQRLSVVGGMIQDYPDLLFSVDTYRPEVARVAIEDYGFDIINDVSEGGDDDAMLKEAARLSVPYILMSARATLQETIELFEQKIQRFISYGGKREDIILDPGYGFGKSMEQNYHIMAHQQQLADHFQLPLLVGISRKRMIWQLLDISVDDALNGTIILNTLALERGANILRVHDVTQAVEVVKIQGNLVINNL